MAVFGTSILFGFNDSNRAQIDGNTSGFAFSSDEGSTWSDCGDLPQNPGFFNSGDPVIAADSQGVFYYAQLGVTSFNPLRGIIQISTATVNPLTRLIEVRNPFVAGVGSTTATFNDKEWITVGLDLDPSKLGQESLYVTWTEFDINNNTTLRFSKWSTGCDPQLLIPSKNVTVNGVPITVMQGSFSLVDKNGNLYIFYEDFTPPFPDRAIRVVKSTDGGQTFFNPVPMGNPLSPARTIDTISACNEPAIQVTPTKQIRMNEFPQAAVGPDNTLYVVWNTFNTTSGSYDIKLASSTDGGITWNVIDIAATASNEIQPSVAVNALGAHVQYTRFVDPLNFALFKRTFDGVTVSAETRLSTADSPVPDTNPNFDSAIANCYMGDYNQIIAGPGTTLYHGWSDNRNGPSGTGNNPDVFFIQS